MAGSFRVHRMHPRTDGDGAAGRAAIVLILLILAAAAALWMLNAPVDSLLPPDPPV